MSQTEALRTQLDTLRLKLQQLEVENLRLQDSNPDEAKLVNVQAELQEAHSERAELKCEFEEATKELQQICVVHNQLLADSRADQQARERLQEEMSSRQCRGEELEEKYSELEQKLGKARRSAELELLRAVNLEREKWEAREARLVKQLEGLERSLQHEDRSNQRPRL